MAGSLRRKALIAAGAFFSLSAGVAHADDARPPLDVQAAAGPSWSGPYIGLVAGAAEGRSVPHSVVDCNVYGFLCDPTPHYPQYGALIGATASGARSQDAFTAGAAAGYNWRLDRFVYGVEADFSALRLGLTDRGSGQSLNLGLTNPGGVPVVFTSGAEASIDWLATLRARAGYLVTPDVLVYGTGGLALTDLSVSNAYSDNWVYNGGGVGGSKAALNKGGYVFGGGAEWAVVRGWSLKAEYLHAEFGSLTTSGLIYPVQVPAAANPFTTSAGLSVNLVRFGLNHDF
jgi:outer membrane immunogenic protein